MWSRLPAAPTPVATSIAIAVVVATTVTVTIALQVAVVPLPCDPFRSGAHQTIQPAPELSVRETHGLVPPPVPSGQHSAVTQSAEQSVVLALELS